MSDIELFINEMLVTVYGLGKNPKIIYLKKGHYDLLVEKMSRAREGERLGFKVTDTEVIYIPTKKTISMYKDIPVEVGVETKIEFI